MQLLVLFEMQKKAEKFNITLIHKIKRLA